MNISPPWTFPFIESQIQKNKVYVLKKQFGKKTFTMRLSLNPTPKERKLLINVFFPYDTNITYKAVIEKRFTDESNEFFIGSWRTNLNIHNEINLHPDIPEKILLDLFHNQKILWGAVGRTNSVMYYRADCQLKVLSLGNSS